MKRIIFLIILIALATIFYLKLFLNKTSDKNPADQNSSYQENFVKESPQIKINNTIVRTQGFKKEIASAPGSKKVSASEKEIFLKKLEKKTDDVKHYMFGILPGLLTPPNDIVYSQYVNIKSSKVIKCIEGDGGRFYFVFDLENRKTILFDFKEKEYIFHFEELETKTEGDDLIITSFKTREEFNLTYKFNSVISKRNQVGEGYLSYKYEKGDRIKEKTWPFSCEITQ